MFNRLMNYGNEILFFDMRSVYQILRGHLNFNRLNNTLIPLPFDWIVKNNLSIEDYQKWIPEVLFKDENLRKVNLINDKKVEAFKKLKRRMIFVVASHTKSIEQFKIQKMFRLKYGRDVLKVKDINQMKDYMALRNAVLLIEALKRQQNCYREVYLIRDGQRAIEHCYSYLCKSKFDRFKLRTIKPPKEGLEFHSGHMFTQYYPCSILKGRLYLGDANHAQQWYALKNMRITHIANITDTVSNCFDNDYYGISYLQIEVNDESSERIIDYFPQFYWFLEDAYNTNLRLDYDLPDHVCSMQVHNFDFKNKKEEKKYQKEIHEVFDKIANKTLLKVTMNKVLVHCQMGRSRSATMVIMYLLYKQICDICDDFDCNLDIMLKYVKDRRICIDPNKGFQSQLEEFESKVRSGEMRKLVRSYDYERRGIQISS